MLYTCSGKNAVEMKGQQSELALSTKVKQVLESTTGTKYTLKTRTELVHPDKIAWYLHLPVAKPEGWISHAQQVGDEVTFESPLMYDVVNLMGFEYRKALSNKKLKDDVPKFQDPKVRQRYSKEVPKVVGFFDALEGLISDFNKRYDGAFSYANDHGMVSVVMKTTASEADDGITLSARLTAMRELLRLVDKASR